MNRSRARRRAMAMGAVYSMGQTNADFVAPTAAQVQATPPGTALSNAAVAMLSLFSSSGIPSEHTSNPTVLAFQKAWNADPLSQINGANGQLSEDGGYGANSQAALDAIANGAPAVNTGPAPAPAPQNMPTTVITGSTGPNWLLWGGVAAAAVGLWLLFRKRRPRVSSVTVRGNCGRRRRRNPLAA